MGKMFVGQVALVLAFVGCVDAVGGDTAPECNGLDSVFEGCVLPEAQPFEPDPDWTPDPAANGGVWGNLPTLCEPSPDGAPCCGSAVPVPQCWDGVAVGRCGDGEWVLAESFNAGLCLASERIFTSCITDQWYGGETIIIHESGRAALTWVGPGVIAQADCQPGELYPRYGSVRTWDANDVSTQADTDRVFERICWDPWTGEEGACQ